MGVEQWDSAKRKYILFDSSEQHSAACERFPFKQIPARVFLDTNVINLLVKHGSHIFEREPLPAGMEMTLANDVEALMHVFSVGAHANWDLFGSPKTLDEISRTKNASLRADLLEYALQLVNQDLNDEDVSFALNFGHRIIDTHFVAALPDVSDRELIGNAIGMECDAFVTCDRTTIISKRERLRGINLRILTPAEWWAHVKPWAGLWG